MIQFLTPSRRKLFHGYQLSLECVYNSAVSLSAAQSACGLLARGTRAEQLIVGPWGIRATTGTRFQQDASPTVCETRIIAHRSYCRLSKVSEYVWLTQANTGDDMR
jgi:hypothetical protein